ncbi:MAG: amino acid--tRNA ligase-related protein [Candidatus Taylorbacteria bacterium]|nr:amino acid--tRNA ligase-related protein [Candidatus Taylorbacteria bacterium]
MRQIHELIDPVEPLEYNFAYNLLHNFFIGRGFIKAAVQHRPDTMAACEDPFNVAIFNYALEDEGEVWPLPQTGQMQLEYELLRDCHRNVPGLFCESTSYRQEPEAVVGRHNLIFPMFEFEMRGTMNDLRRLEINLLESAGFGEGNNFVGNSYQATAAHYGVRELTGDHEAMIGKEFGCVYFLEYFPEYTSPFWNMKREGNVAKKIDVILHGIETIGSAERSTEPGEMRDRFHSISGGAYAKQLYARFTKKRVERALERFLSLPFIPRSGGGIGMNRWIRALKLEGLMSNKKVKEF